MIRSARRVTWAAAATAAVLAALILPAGARAASSGSVAITAVDGTQLTFSAAGTFDCAGSAYCGWWPTLQQTTIDRACTGYDDLLWVGPLSEEASQSWTLVEQPYGWYAGVSPTRFCLVVNGGGTEVVGHVDYTPPTAPPPPSPPPAPAPSPPPPAPAVAAPPDPFPDLVRERIPDHAGFQGWGYGFNLSLGDVPPRVGVERWQAVVSAVAERWGLDVGGTTYRVPMLRDGYDDVGFGPVRGSSLGVYREHVVVTYRRRLVCRKRWRWRGGRLRRVRRCFWRKRIIDERVVDRDVRISRWLPWQPGPAKPSTDEYDLQSVVIHELGHFAGNRRHVAYCVNSPMIESLDKGEWWHSPTDWYLRHCGVRRANAPEARAAAQPDGRFAREIRRMNVDVADDSVRGRRRLREALATLHRSQARSATLARRSRRALPG